MLPAERERDTQRDRERERERERETERDRERDRETERETERDRERDRETERDRERQRETERDRERQRETERDRERGYSKKVKNIFSIYKVIQESLHPSFNPDGHCSQENWLITPTHKAETNNERELNTFTPYGLNKHKAWIPV